MTSGTADLVAQARAGDRVAWGGLVRRHLGLVHAVCRCHGVDGAAADRVNEAVWARLAELLPRLADVPPLGPWVAATARVECGRQRRAAGGPMPSGSSSAPAESGAAGGRGRADVLPDPACAPDDDARAALAAAQEQGVVSRRALRLLAAEPPLGDDTIAAALGLTPAEVATLLGDGLSRVAAGTGGDDG